MEDRTDAELLDAYCAMHDGAAFAELVRRYQTLVYRACYRLLGDPHESEDASQAVFVVLAEKAPGLRRNDLSAWLYRVAHHVAAKVVRSRVRRVQREEAYMAEERTVGCVPDGDGGVADPAVLKAVDSALMTLPGRYREAVILRYLRGFSERDAAGTAQCPIGTISKRASRGIERLRKRLGKLGFAVTAPALVGLLTAEASAAVPETLLPSILGLGFGAGKSAIGLASYKVAMVAKGALKMMFMAKLKVATVVAAAACATVVGTSVVVVEYATVSEAAKGPVEQVSKVSGESVCELTVVLESNGATRGGFSINSAYRSVRVVAVHSQPATGPLAANDIICAWTLKVDTFGLLKNPARVRFDARKTGIRNDATQYWIKQVDGQSVPELVRLSATDNGAEITAAVGSLIVVALKNDHQGAGWEPAPTEVNGESVMPKYPARRKNCDSFDWIYSHAFHPPAATVSNTVGTYSYEYTCTKPGLSTIRLQRIEPGGPDPQRRTASMKLSEWSVRVDVMANVAMAARIPRNGQIVASIPLPRSAPWVTKLLWARDGKHIVVVIDPTIKVNNGSISKEGPDENNVLAVDLGTKETRQLFTTAGTPMSMAGNRLLVPMAGKLLLIEDLGLGARKELPGKEWYLPRVSQDGKYVAYFTGDMGQSYDTATIRLATAEGEVSDLAFPAEGAPGPELKQVRSPRYWTPDGRLFLASTWVKDGENTAKATWTYWLYDPKANRFEKTDSLPRSGFPYTRMAWGKIMRHDGSWFAVGPEPKFQRPAVRSGKPGGPLIGGSGGGGGTTHATNGTNVTAVAPPPGAGAMGDVKVENVSETIEFLDVAGKVLRKVALDIQALAGTSLFVHTASADGHYLLASTFTTVQFMSGMPFPKLEKTLLIDLQTGKLLPKFEIDPAQYGMRTAFTAVMSASREVLVVNQPKGNPASFLFSFPFDGGAPVDCGTALALPVSGMNWQNTAAFGDIDQMNSRRMDADRIVMGVQPRNWANVQDPKYRNEPRRLLVFWNSTQPIAAFASRGLADEPTNITWSPAGDRFAFTAGATLHVWQPMRE